MNADCRYCSFIRDVAAFLGQSYHREGLLDVGFLKSLEANQKPLSLLGGTWFVADQALFLGGMFFRERNGLRVMAGRAALFRFDPVLALPRGFVEGAVLVIEGDSLGLLAGGAQDEQNEHDSDRRNSDQVSFGYFHQGCSHFTLTDFKRSFSDHFTPSPGFIFPPDPSIFLLRRSVTRSARTRSLFTKAGEWMASHRTGL